MDIWRAAAPAIDFLAPDIYLLDFKAVCASYVRSGNPLMIPEARQGRTLGLGGAHGALTVLPVKSARCPTAGGCVRR